MKTDSPKFVGHIGLILLLAVGNPRARADDAVAAKTAQTAPVDPFTAADVDAIAADVQAKVAANAPAKAYDGVLLKITNMVPVLVYARTFQGQRLTGIGQFVTHWQDYKFALESGNYGKALQEINNVVTQSSQMYSVIPRSELLAEQNTTAAAAAESRKEVMATITKHLGDAIASAKTPAVFDAVLAEIEAAQQANSANTYPLQSLRQYTALWQECIADIGSNSPKAPAMLEALSRSNEPFAAQFRYRIAELSPKVPGAAVPTPAPVPEAPPDPAGLTLDNIETYETKLNLVPHGNGYASETQVAAGEIMLTIGARNKLMLGDPQPALELYASRSNQSLGAYSLPVEKVRSVLAIQAINFQFRDVDPAAGDTVTSYLRRVVEARSRAKDWQGVLDALQDSISTSGPFGSGRQDAVSNIGAYHNLLVGIHEESAGLYSLAVSSYLAAISSTGNMTPVDELASRLKGIKASHPKEYADGEASQDKHLLEAEQLAAQGMLIRQMNIGNNFPGAQRAFPQGVPQMGGPPTTSPAPSPTPPPAATANVQATAH